MAFTPITPNFVTSANVDISVFAGTTDLISSDNFALVSSDNFNLYY